MSVRAVVLAAGKGTRMKSDDPKVLFPVAGRPIVAWVVDAVRSAGVDDITVVVGHGSDDVAAALGDGVVTAVQDQQLGTGHATMAGLAAMGDVSGDTVLVVAGDSPLIEGQTLIALLEAHAAAGSGCTLLTTSMVDPTGYGRIIRDGDQVLAIVEERDADDDQRLVREVGVSVYAFSGEPLMRALDAIGNDNDQSEYYLTDTIAVLATDGVVHAVDAADPAEVQGINTHEQLAEVNRLMRRRINRSWMEAGVWMQDPDAVYIDASVRLESGARLYSGTHLEGATEIGAGAEVGPETVIRGSTIGAGARVWYSVVRGAEIGPGAEVGPYASLRPGTVLGADAKAGTFVELKETSLGRGAKVPHLSYMGDAVIGEDANVGAGSITCNYDGVHKHQTVIGDRAFIGSDTMLVAPIEIGDDAFTGAGSVITRDVSPGALGVERSTQKEVPGYAARRAKQAESEGE